MPNIGNQIFHEIFFDDYIINIFGEAFSHTSLSTEKLFNECNKYSLQLQAFMSNTNKEFYDLLLRGSEDDKKLLEIRSIEALQYLKIMKSIKEEREYDEEGNPLPCLRDFEAYLPYIIRPYRNNKEVLNFVNDGKYEGKRFKSESMIDRIEALYTIVWNKLSAQIKAQNCKKDNLNAFEYAYRCKNIGVNEIIKINEYVNKSEGIHVGFKSTNNLIYQDEELPFDVCPKELVHTKIIELLYNYENTWKTDILNFNLLEEISEVNRKINDDGLSLEEALKLRDDLEERRKEYNKAFFLREARFHIEFERIHPFEDGNGRTGRIILNKHLIDNGFAPIIIASEIRDDYIKCIDNSIRTEGEKQLAQLIQMLSSAQKSDMVSVYRKTRNINPSELSNSEKGEKDTSEIIKDERIEDDTIVYHMTKERKPNK